VSQKNGVLPGQPLFDLLLLRSVGVRCQSLYFRKKP
jgi:hypothetical protein